MAKKYVAPKAGTGLIKPIVTDMLTPILTVKFSSLIHPFYYPNSPKIPRYSLTALVNGNENEEFVNTLQQIEISNDAETALKSDKSKVDGYYVYTGDFLMKFQDRKTIPIYQIDYFPDDPASFSPDLSNKEPLELEGELAEGEHVQIKFNIMRYTKKNSYQPSHGISYVPVEIYYFPTVQEASLDEDS